MKDLPEIRVKLRDVIIAGFFLCGLTATGALGYFKLYDMAKAGQRAADSMPRIECYVRQMNSFIIDGRKPLPHESCEHSPMFFSAP